MSIVSSYDEQKAIEGEELMKNGTNYIITKAGITSFWGIKPSTKQKFGIAKKEKVIKKLDEKAVKAELKSGIDPLDAKAKSERRRELLGGMQPTIATSTGTAMSQLAANGPLPKVSNPAPFQGTITVNIDGMSLSMTKKNENVLYTRFMGPNGRNYRFLRLVFSLGFWYFHQLDL